MFGAYLAEIRHIPLLSPDAERVLSERARDGDPAARAELAARNTRLVVRIARGYVARARRLGMGLEDLVGVGNVALVDAARHFDPGAGARFSTYAAASIRRRLRAHLDCHATPIRTPDWLSDPSRARPGDARYERRAAAATLARRRPAGPAAMASLAGRPGDDPAAAAERADDLAALRRALGALTGRERVVLGLRFGLGGPGEGLTLEECGARVGVSKDRARQIVNGCLDKLAARMGVRESA